MDAMQWLQDNDYGLVPVNVPTGGDDYDVEWQVIEYHMAQPEKRIIGRGRTPSEAIDHAMAEPSGECRHPGVEQAFLWPEVRRLVDTHYVAFVTDREDNQLRLLGAYGRSAPRLSDLHQMMWTESTLLITQQVTGPSGPRVTRVGDLRFILARRQRQRLSEREPASGMQA